MQSKLVMEGDNPSPEEHESADSEEQSGSTGNVRTYDCTFCKRGFSNAQALGGHMNIHRRDRAKMKQPTNLSQLPPYVSNEFVPLYSPHRTNYMSQLVHGDDDGGLFKWPRILPTQQNIHGDDIHEARPRQLPLFLETALRGEDWPSRSTRERKEEEGSASSPAAVELDLELRLGVKPPDKTMDRKGFV